MDEEYNKNKIPRFTPFKCPNCNGFTTVSYGKRVCPTCKGKGVIVIDQETGFPVSNLIDDGYGNTTD